MQLLTQKVQLLPLVQSLTISLEIVFELLMDFEAAHEAKIQWI